MVNNNQTRPLYDLRTAQDLASRGQLKAVTERADQDVINLGWDHEDIAKVICALKPRHFRGQFECTLRNVLKMADVYVICYDENTGEEHRNGAEFYIKFFINAANTLLAVVSCHYSR